MSSDDEKEEALIRLMSELIRSVEFGKQHTLDVVSGPVNSNRKISNATPINVNRSLMLSPPYVSPSAVTANLNTSAIAAISGNSDEVVANDNVNADVPHPLKGRRLGSSNLALNFHEEGVEKPAGATKVVNILVDDWHHLDAGSLRMFNGIVEHGSTTHKLLIIGTATHAVKKRKGGQEGGISSADESKSPHSIYDVPEKTKCAVVEIEIQPMNPNDISSALFSAFHLAMIDPIIMENILAACNGNPVFLFFSRSPKFSKPKVLCDSIVKVLSALCWSFWILRSFFKAECT